MMLGQFKKKSLNFFFQQIQAGYISFKDWMLKTFCV